MIAAPELAGPWSGPVVLIALAVAAALVASPLGFRAPGAVGPTGVARVAGRFAFYALALALSLPTLAAGAALLAPPPLGFWLAVLPPFLVALACLLVGLRSHDVDPLARGEAMLVAATVAAFAAGLSLPNGQGAPLVGTLALVFLGAGRIVRGSAHGARAVHLEGLVVVLLAIAAKLAASMLEPALKAGALLAAIAAATVAIVTFERRLQK
ncbi:MAG: hypothetical protein QM704_03185 [Anaeromyxobacteraceae bacterium]